MTTEPTRVQEVEAAIAGLGYGVAVMPPHTTITLARTLAAENAELRRRLDAVVKSLERGLELMAKAQLYFQAVLELDVTREIHTRCIAIAKGRDNG